MQDGNQTTSSRARSGLKPQARNPDPSRTPTHFRTRFSQGSFAGAYGPATATQNSDVQQPQGGSSGSASRSSAQEEEPRLTEPPPSQDTMVIRLVLWAYGRTRYLVTVVPATTGGSHRRGFRVSSRFASKRRRHTFSHRSPHSNRGRALNDIQARASELARCTVNTLLSPANSSARHLAQALDPEAQGRTRAESSSS